jgi:hypothetical protein
VTDIGELLTKISIETYSWRDIKDLIEIETQTEIIINWSGVISNIWIINFETLREDENKFADPNWNPYKFAYAQWQVIKDNGEKEWYSFMQLAAIMEKSETAKLVWNYFQYDENDSPSLFKVW